MRRIGTAWNLRIGWERIEVSGHCGTHLLERKGHHGNAVFTRCQQGDIRLVESQSTCV